MKPPRPRENPAARDAASALAIQALGFLASDPERLERFLALTGIGHEAVRTAARQPGFLAGVLEYIASDERLLLAFATHAEIGPEEVERARQRLAGDRWERDVP